VTIIQPFPFKGTREAKVPLPDLNPPYIVPVLLRSVQQREMHIMIHEVDVGECASRWRSKGGGGNENHFDWKLNKGGGVNNGHS
jgi:hypothetical protein